MVIATNHRPEERLPVRCATSPSSERTDAVAEVAPETVDADCRAAPVGVGDVGDRGGEIRIEQRHAEAGDRRRDRPTTRPASPNSIMATPAPHSHMPHTIGFCRPMWSESWPVKNCEPPHTKPYTPTTQPMCGEVQAALIEHTPDRRPRSARRRISQPARPGSTLPCACRART